MQCMHFAHCTVLGHRLRCLCSPCGRTPIGCMQHGVCQQIWACLKEEVQWPLQDTSTHLRECFTMALPTALIQSSLSFTVHAGSQIFGGGIPRAKQVSKMGSKEPYLLIVGNKEHAFCLCGYLKSKGLVDGVFCPLDGQALVHLHRAVQVDCET